MQKCKYLFHGQCHNNAKFLEADKLFPNTFDDGFLVCEENFSNPECKCYEPAIDNTVKYKTPEDANKAAVSALNLNQIVIF